MILDRILTINKIGYIFYGSARIEGKFMEYLKYFLFVLIFTFASIVYAQTQDSSASDLVKPALEFDHTEYDFGSVNSDTAVTHVYTFRNVSSDTIKINKVGTSWGCTGSLLSSEEIAPGDSGEIKVTFNAKHRQGEQHKRISVYTDDKIQAVYRLILKGEVKKEETPE